MQQRTPSRRPPSPMELLRDMREQMDEILRTTFRGPAAQAAGFEPSVDIRETDDALILTAELPGLRPEDVEIVLENNVLTIRGEKKEERVEEGEDRYVLERQYGTFSRSFMLPRTVDADRINARFQDGVLTVVMPKVEERRGKRIDIERGERQQQQQQQRQH